MGPQLVEGQEIGVLSRKAGLAVLIAATVLIVVIALLLPRIPQPQSYHLFADRRTFFGVPNFEDVASNVPFAFVGAWGLVFLGRLRGRRLAECFVDGRERWPWAVFFVGVLLTAFGSSYYHWNPNNSTLVWDRVPMTVSFMSLVAALIAERIDLRVGLWLLPVLLIVGIGSVFQWYSTELRGVGDLRFYAAVQVYAVVFVLVMMCFPSRYTYGSALLWVAGLYVLAKLLETFDRQIFALTGDVVSGHTLKHLAAAAASYWVLRMLMKRRRSVVAGFVVRDRCG